MASWIFLDAAAQSTCASPLTAAQTTIVLASSAAFGNPTGGQQAGLIILDSGNPAWNPANPLATPYEYVYETGNVSGTNTITVIRGRANSTAKTFFAGATIAHTFLAEALAPDATGAFLRSDSGPALYTARAWQAVQQTMLNATPSRLLLDTKNYDPNTNFDASGAKGTYTCPVAGKYLVCGTFGLVSAARMQIFVAKNGANYGKGDDPGAGQVTQYVNVVDIVDAAANDTLTLVVTQTSAGTVLTDNTDPSRNFMSIHYLGI